MLKVTLTSAIGNKYLLTGTRQSSPVVCPEEALVILVAEESRTDVAVPGAFGVVAGQARYGAIQAELPFMLNADTGEKMETLYREFRQGWSRSKPCVMQVEADRPGGPYFLDLVLDRHLGGVPVDMSRRTSAVVTVPVFNAGGMFRSALKTGTGDVTVTNSGDVSYIPQNQEPRRRRVGHHTIRSKIHTPEVHHGDSGRHRPAAPAPARRIPRVGTPRKDGDMGSTRRSVP